MSLHDPLSPPASPGIGGATVADLRSLEGPQALVVMMLRDWFDGAEGRRRVRDAFAEGLPPAAARDAVDAWAELGRLVADGTRRPVMRHATTCTCVGADEAVLAQVLTLAARGEREDAMLVLSLLVRGERLLPAVAIASRAGLACLRLSARWRAEMQRDGATRLH